MISKQLNSLILKNYGEYKSPNIFEFKTYKKPTVSLIIPVFNHYELTRNCLWSLLQHTKDVSYEIIIADDVSSDDTKNISKHIKNIQHIRMKKNSGFGANVENAIKYANGKYIALLNNDMLFYDNWLKPIIDKLESDKTIGAAGGTLIGPDGRINELGAMISESANIIRIGRGLKYSKKLCGLSNSNFDYKSGCCLVLSKKLWDKLGGFDKNLRPAYFEDTDLCFRIHEIGLKISNVFESRIMHFETQSYNFKDKTKIKHTEYFNDKWLHVIKSAKRVEYFNQVAKKYISFAKHSKIFYKFMDGNIRKLYLFGIKIADYKKSGCDLLLSTPDMTKPILVITHIYYTDQLDLLVNSLKNIHYNYELYVTSDIKNKKIISEKISKQKSDFHFIASENIGYDIWPFIKVINNIDLSKYSCVIKLHTKRDMPNTKYFEFGNGYFMKQGSRWRENLLEFIKNPENLEKCITALQTKNIGMCTRYNLIHNKPNHCGVISEAKRNYPDYIFGLKDFSFVAGTMFISKPEPISMIKNMNISKNLFQKNQKDHAVQFAHVIERTIGEAVYKCSTQIADPFTSPEHIKQINKMYKKLKRTKRIINYMFLFVPFSKLRRKLKNSTFERWCNPFIQQIISTDNYK
nr:glycosyltransferase [Candidatus Enterousia merdequi]